MFGGMSLSEWAVKNPQYMEGMRNAAYMGTDRNYEPSPPTKPPTVWQRLHGAWRGLINGWRDA